MKKYALSKTVLLLLLFFCFYHSHSQVFLSYAKDTSQIYVGGDSNFTITGKRITVSDSDHYYLGGAPYNRMGTAIYLSFCKNVVISNCIIGPTGGKGIYLEGCDSVTITNCIFLDNTSAVITWGSSKVKIYNNQFLNVNNQHLAWQVPCQARALTPPHDLPDQPANGREGGFVQLRGSSGGGNVIKDNVGENVFGHSCPEDLINVSHSPFASDQPLLVINNRFRGGGPSGTGGGILIGDDLGPVPTYPGTANVLVYNNKLVDPGQYGIQASGANVTVDHNQIYGRSQRHNNVGMIAGDGYSHGYPYCSRIEITNNTISYMGRYPQGSDTAYPSYFVSDYACGIDRDSVWYLNNNVFDTAAIHEDIIPERLLAPISMVYLKFDNDLNDYSGANLNATATGSASIVCDGYRKAISLNGTTDLLTLPQSVWLQPASQMISVSAWIKPDNLSLIQGIFRSQNSGGWEDGWRGAIGAGTTLFVPVVNTDNGRISTDCDGIVANAWNFVAFTYDGKVLKGYINGVLKGTSYLTGNIIYTLNANLQLGGSEGCYNFAGKMAEFRFFNGIRTAAELLDEYNTIAPQFDGTATNGYIYINANYYANGQSKSLLSVDGVQSDSYGVVSPVAPAASYFVWTVLAGTPYYATQYGADLQISLPSGGYADLEVAASTGYCMLPAKRVFTLVANWWEPFSIKLPPGSSEIIITKLTTEKPVMPPNTERKIPGITMPKIVSRGVYTIRVTNVLGQVIQSAIMKDGKSNLNIRNAIPGVYIVSISNNKGVVHVEKIIKN